MHLFCVYPDGMQHIAQDRHLTGLCSWRSGWHWPTVKHADGNGPKCLYLRKFLIWWLIGKAQLCTVQKKRSRECRFLLSLMLPRMRPNSGKPPPHGAATHGSTRCREAPCPSRSPVGKRGRWIIMFMFMFILVGLVVFIINIRMSSVFRLPPCIPVYSSEQTS